MIIHVSGSPGSGKSTFGEQLKRDFVGKVTVIDTDDLITHESDDGRELDKLVADLTDTDFVRYKRRWTEIFTKRINAEIARATTGVLIFVGILNHFGPPDGSIVSLDAATERFFIDLPMKHLLRQLYTRYSKELGQDDEFWTGVAEEKYNIPDSKGVIRESNREKQWHADHGYKLMSTEKIYGAIKRFVSARPLAESDLPY